MLRSGSTLRMLLSCRVIFSRRSCAASPCARISTKPMVPASSMVSRSRRSIVRWSETLGSLPLPYLRMLDALHLEAAIRLDASAVLTYDQRLADAAWSVGLTVISPGAAQVT